MRIRWTQHAVSDLTHICDYIRDHDRPAAARTVAVRIHDAASSLVQFPSIGRTGRKSNTRELVVTRSPFLLVYRIQTNTIEILRILHGAQRWP